MRVAGIIAEYDPFHNGHRFHIETTRRMGATHVVVVMSSAFTQRAEPALLPKFERAECAALGGADLVIELPAPYATASSGRFAKGGVALLAALGCVDTLSFGSECGDMAKLCRARDAVNDPRLGQLMERLASEGKSYPIARREALDTLFPGLSSIFEGQNNSLGIDYLTALEQLGGPMAALTVPRAGAAHNSPEGVGDFASASLVRDLIGGGGEAERYLPPSTAAVIRRAARAGRLSTGYRSVESAILMRLRETPRESFLALPDCSTGLGDRLYTAAGQAASFEELLDMAKTRSYTMTRVRRAALAAFLGIEPDMSAAPPPYARILAIGERGDELLRAISRRSSLPMSHSLQILAGTGPEAARFSALERRVSDIYGLTLYRRGPRGEDLAVKLFRSPREGRKP